MGASYSRADEEQQAAPPAPAVEEQPAPVPVAEPEPQPESQPEPEPQPQADPEPEPEPESEPVENIIKIQTVPNDVRFSSTNQARHCYTRYNEYYKCIAEKGKEHKDCEFCFRAFMSLCPSEWIERWEESRQEGSWPGKY